METGVRNSTENLEEQLAESDPDQQDDVDSDSEIAIAEQEDFEHHNPQLVSSQAEHWIELSKHPKPTGDRIVQALRRFKRTGRSSLTVLIIGKGTVGKSTTINSLFGTDVVDVTTFTGMTQDLPHPFIVRKRASGVAFTTIDAQGIVDTDQVCDSGIKRIANQLRHLPIDVVLFIDRFDVPQADDLDFQIMIRLTKTFGNSFWSRVIIGLTRSELKDLTPSQSYEGMVRNRVDGIRGLIRRAGGSAAQLPFVLIENSEDCERNSDGERIVRNDEPWVPKLFETIVEIALCSNDAFRYNSKTVNYRETFITNFCHIPLLLAIQILIKLFIIDPIIMRDGLLGDRYGPFDQAQRDQERKKFDDRKEAEKRRKSQRSSGKRIRTPLENELYKQRHDDDDGSSEDDD